MECKSDCLHVRKHHECLYNSQFPAVLIRFALFASRSQPRAAAADHFHRAPHATRQTMSFAVSASATRVVASARAPVKAQRASAAAFAAPASKTNSAARLSMRSVADAVALRADKSVAARAGSRGTSPSRRQVRDRAHVHHDQARRRPARLRECTPARLSCSGTVHRSNTFRLPDTPRSHPRAPRRFPPKLPPPADRALTPQLPRPRRQMGEIISRFEKKGMVCKGLKTFMTPREVAEEHYKDLSSKPFFGDLCDYICSGPSCAWSGRDPASSSPRG